MIKPGQTLEFEHVLGGVYNFTTAGASTYEVVPTNDATLFTQLTPAGEIKSIRAEVPQAHSATLAGSLVPTSYVSAKRATGLSKRAHAFNGYASLIDFILLR